MASFHEFYNQDVVEEDLTGMLKAAIIGSGLLLSTPSSVEGAKIPTTTQSFKSQNFYHYLMNMENAGNVGWNSKKRKWFPHESAEGGRKTIAYGHKLKPGEDYSKGITHAQAIELMKKDAINAAAGAMEVVDARFGEGTYVRLSGLQKQMLIDFVYNGGKGLLIKFKNFTKGVVKNDIDLVKKEYLRYYKDKKGKSKLITRRNNAFAIRFIGSIPTQTKSKSRPVKAPKAVELVDYKIKPGDNFWDIAKSNNTTVGAIKKANPEVEPKRLKIGQKIKLPRP